MATVKIKKPEIVTIEYRQEEFDEDYGSCLWARFNFDIENYDLTILSDCGEYGHGWIPTPNTESFLLLMSRLNDEYLLEKISDRTVVDCEATFTNVKEYISNVLDGEKPDFDLEDIENACYYASVNEVYTALEDVFKFTNANNDYADNYALYECIVTTFPYDAKKIVQVFTDFIQPKIKEMLQIEEALELISNFTRNTPKSDEIYIFTVILCDNEIDRDYERFSVDALNMLKEMFVGVTGIFDHGFDHTARIYKTEVTEDKTRRTAAGEYYTYLKAWCFMPKTGKNKELIEKIETGIKREISIACSVNKRTCSACGEDISKCGHHLGEIIDGNVCHAVLDEPTDVYEWSFVKKPHR